MTELATPTPPDGVNMFTRDAFVSNQYFRAIRLTKAGVKITGHSHTFDHVSVLARGAVKCTVNGETNVYDAEASSFPVLIFIRKHDQHEFEALADNTIIICCHADRLGRDSGDILDAEMVPDGVMTPEIARLLVPMAR